MPRVLTGRRRLAAAFTILLASFAGTGVAHATQSPDADAAGIEVALIDDCTQHQQGCVFNGGLVSSVDAEYAFGSATGSTSSYDAVLVRNDVSSADWLVLKVLTPQVTCGELEARIPPQVLDDLEIKAVQGASTAPVVCGKPAQTPKSCSSFRSASVKYAVSVLRISCAKARSLLNRMDHTKGAKAKGWSLTFRNRCEGYVVAHKDRDVLWPLVELTGSQPVIFIDDITTAECTGDDSAPSAATAG